MVKRSFGPRRSVSLEIWSRRRAFQFWRTCRSWRTGPRDQTLRWEQTEEGAGNASHLSTRDTPATRPQCWFSLHLKFAHACKMQLLNFKFNTWNRGATHNEHSSDDGHIPETSGHSLRLWHFHKRGIEWSLRALASMRAVRLFLRARAVIKYVLRKIQFASSEHFAAFLGGI